ncbi:hypothetical protein A2160_00015 [Candidatus Beckwithbacteria bacterium RBG_13_42_9]|uniref:Uncharacterized protein n=1 Tax=Candidatus Beckwithbacteria bacterium RBG_13_42_9 TaxID=1797457 RepID=A0A1F5E404_9BACT|nr:MAG: hypothetical protein A2160_00015 [Candidatus Beckwithbacteria bacterium RBG_13_42_9]
MVEIISELFEKGQLGQAYLIVFWVRVKYNYSQNMYFEEEENADSRRNSGCASEKRSCFIVK